MNNGVSKPGRRPAFKRSDIARLLEAAKSVPKKSETKDELTVRELVPQLLPAIRTMTAKGYSYQDIAGWLVDQGVAASEDTLKSVIGEVLRSRQSASSPQSAKDGKGAGEPTHPTPSPTRAVSDTSRVVASGSSGSRRVSSLDDDV